MTDVESEKTQAPLCLAIELKAHNNQLLDANDRKVMPLEVIFALAIGVEKLCQVKNCTLNVRQNLDDGTTRYGMCRLPGMNCYN